MPDDLTPASSDDLRDILAGAMRRDRRGKPTRLYVDVAAHAAAEHLIEAMRLAGFVVMRRPPAPNHTGALPPHAPSNREPQD